jgi:hypothetical protein
MVRVDQLAPSIHRYECHATASGTALAPLDADRWFIVGLGRCERWRGVALQPIAVVACFVPGIDATVSERERWRLVRHAVLEVLVADVDPLERGKCPLSVNCKFVAEMRAFVPTA